MKVFASMAKYIKGLFIQRQLIFSPFPLLLMVCFVNCLFPQVEGMKWNSRSFFSRKLISENVGVYFTYYKCNSGN